VDEVVSHESDVAEVIHQDVAAADRVVELCVPEAGQRAAALELSFGLRPPLTEGHFRLVPLDQDPLWVRVDVSATPDIEAGLRTSDFGPSNLPGW
jgi:hypothetical protein